jgi:hypothetical protein
MVLMVVIITSAGRRQRRCLTALSRRKESHRIDFTTVRRGWIGTTGDVVRLHVVVDERDPLADGDDQLARIRTAR